MDLLRGGSTKSSEFDQITFISFLIISVYFFFLFLSSVLPNAETYLSNLPDGELYEKSYMHRDIVNFGKFYLMEVELKGVNERSDEKCHVCKSGV